MRLALLLLALVPLGFSAFAEPESQGLVPGEAAREADALLKALDKVDALKFENVLVLEALHQGNVDCAICLLEAEVDIAIKRANRLLRDSPSDELQDSLELPLEMLTTYRAQNPWDPSTCPRGVCRTSE